MCSKVDFHKNQKNTTLVFTKMTSRKGKILTHRQESNGRHVLQNSNIKSRNKHQIKVEKNIEFLAFHQK